MQENNMNYPKFKVCVRCFTFNQSKYITDALNGFTMQQTDFPFVCCIVDDASTDGEQEVIRKYVEENFDFSEGSVFFHKETDYAHITYAQHKTNKNCYFAVLYLKENHYSQKKPKMQYLSEWRDGTEYEALCEGDDYWIHPKKLQMQVDFLDENKEYSMCFHRAEVKVEEGVNTKKDGRVNLYKNLEEREYTAAEILRQWTIPTASVVHRKGIKGIQDKRFIFGDTPFFLSCAEVGKIYCVDKHPMSVYRLLSNSAVSIKRNWKEYVDHFKGIEENYADIHLKKVARKYILNYYVGGFISGRLGKQSFDVLIDIIRNDPKYVFSFLVSLPMRAIGLVTFNLIKK